MNEHNDIISKLFEQGIGYIWFIMLAIWGGTVNYLTRINRGNVQFFSFFELMGEWFISGFAGLLTAYVCIEMEMSWNMTAFFTGVSGHLGGRAIGMLESYAKRHFPSFEEEIVKQSKEERKDDDDSVR